MRNLTAEVILLEQHLILPVFVALKKEHFLPSNLGFVQLVPSQIGRFLQATFLPSKIGGIALFPVVKATHKNNTAACAFDGRNPLFEALYEFKKCAPQTGIFVDVALDPFTCHGHDGVLAAEDVENDQTVELLTNLALLYAQAGADVLAPSDMMDGRIGAIRRHIDTQGFQKTLIMSYAVKYASAFYGPFRQCLGSDLKKTISKATYQMDIRNASEAYLEAAQDIQEGSDLLMVKPGGYSLDILANLKTAAKLPLVAFQVSGEYAMLKSAATNGWLDYAKALLESLTVLRRAGASGIVTYGALDAARLLKKNS